MTAPGLPPDESQHHTALCTIASKNRLAQVRVLAHSFRRHHPEIPIYLLLADEAAGYYDPSVEPFTTLTLEEMPIRNLRGFCFQYSCLELNTAVKPFLLAHLLDQWGYRKVLYFDGDIKFYHGIAPLLKALDSASVILTPHLTEPLTEDATPSERDILLVGTHNLGFVGLARTPTTGRLLRWWQERLYKYCIFDMAAGLFVDQRWMDLVPGMFGDTTIIRDPGCNVAYWNLEHRKLECVGDRYLVNGEPLRFFHFSGFDPDNKEIISSHSTHCRVQDRACLPQVFAEYAAELVGAGDREIRGWPYAFATFDDGTLIPDIVRTIYRELDAKQSQFGDPFQTGPGSFLAWLNEPVPESGRARPVVTRLAYEVYRRRPDLWFAFPQPTGKDRTAFARWMARDGAAHYWLQAPFIEALKLSGSATSARERLVTALARLGLGKMAARLVGHNLKNRMRDRLLWGQRRALTQSAPPDRKPGD